jgi:chemotaxis protein methyltransferase CheR
VKPSLPPPALVDMLAEVIEERSGLHFAGARRAELIAKLIAAFRISGCTTWESYHLRLQSDAGGELFRLLIETLTIGETYFFRHHAYFDMFERDILPALIERRRQTRSMRIWCAGCATGEEAYSLAILLLRAIPDIERWQINILATDINRQSLARAAAGVYGDWSFRETDDFFRRTYFKREGNRYRIRPDIQRLVHFSELNLAETAYPSVVNDTAALDLIVCRNVLIYFGRDMIHSVLKRFHTALAPDGYLMLGPSDTYSHLMDGFAPIRALDATLYRRIQHEPEIPVREAVVANQPLVARAVNGAPVPPTAAPPPVVTASDWREAMQNARASANSGLLAEAERFCREAIARADMRPEPFFLLGTLREAQGDDAQALQAFRQALYIDRSFVPVHLAIAASQRRMGRDDLAEQALSRARRLLDGRAADEVILADEQLTVGRLRDALTRITDEAPIREDS